MPTLKPTPLLKTFLTLIPSTMDEITHHNLDRFDQGTLLGLFFQSKPPETVTKGMFVQHFLGKGMESDYIFGFTASLF